MRKEIAGINMPDSRLAIAARTLVRSVSLDVVYNHALRTYVFGGLCAAAQSVKCDQEFFYRGALLHDLGLTEVHGGRGRFEVAGADAADAFLESEGLSSERRAIIWEAIALHTSVGVAIRRRPEVALVHIGAGIDVLGIGLGDLPKHLVEETLDALPRCDFKNAFIEILLKRISRTPAAVAMTWMSDVGRRHIHGFRYADFVETVRSPVFGE